VEIQGADGITLSAKNFGARTFGGKKFSEVSIISVINFGRIRKRFGG